MWGFLFYISIYCYKRMFYEKNIHNRITIKAGA